MASKSMGDVHFSQSGLACANAPNGLSPRASRGDDGAHRARFHLQSRAARPMARR
jgi:hypothetical protein